MWLLAAADWFRSIVPLVVHFPLIAFVTVGFLQEHEATHLIRLFFLQVLVVALLLLFQVSCASPPFVLLLQIFLPAECSWFVLTVYLSHETSLLVVPSSQHALVAHPFSQLVASFLFVILDFALRASVVLLSPFVFLLPLFQALLVSRQVVVRMLESLILGLPVIRIRFRHWLLP